MNSSSNNNPKPLSVNVEVDGAVDIGMTQWRFGWLPVDRPIIDQSPSELQRGITVRAFRLAYE